MNSLYQTELNLSRQLAVVQLLLRSCRAQYPQQHKATVEYNILLPLPQAVPPTLEKSKAQGIARLVSRQVLFVLAVSKLGNERRLSGRPLFNCQVQLFQFLGPNPALLACALSCQAATRSHGANGPVRWGGLSRGELHYRMLSCCVRLIGWSVRGWSSVASLRRYGVRTATAAVPGSITTTATVTAIRCNGYGWE